MRFFAIVLIVIYHLFRPFLPGGFIAVDIFFAISGFLIFAKLLQEYQKTNKISYRKFILERLKRIFPPLLICVIITLTIALFVNKDILAGIQLRTAAALSFTTNIVELFTGGNYENTISPNLFEHTWFLALEMQFYLLMPLIAKMVLYTQSNKKKAVQTLMIAFVVLGLLSDILMAIYGGLLGATNRSYFAIDTHMGAFCLGAAFAALNHLVPRTPRTPKLVPSIGVALSLVIISILAFKTEYSDAFTFIFTLPFVGILSVILIFCIIKLQNNRHSRRKAPIVIRVMEYLGSLSFGIYLFHYPLYVLLPEILPANTPEYVAPAINIALSVFLSWFFTEIFRLPHIIEKIRRGPIRPRLMRAAVLVLLCVPAIVTLVITPTRNFGAGFSQHMKYRRCTVISYATLVHDKKEDLSEIELIQRHLDIHKNFINKNIIEINNYFKINNDDQKNNIRGKDNFNKEEFKLEEDIINKEEDINDIYEEEDNLSFKRHIKLEEYKDNDKLNYNNNFIIEENENEIDNEKEGKNQKTSINNKVMKIKENDIEKYGIKINETIYQIKEGNFHIVEKEKHLLNFNFLKNL